MLVPVNFLSDRTLAIEPRENIKWPDPCIVNTEDGHTSIQNNLDEPIRIKKNQIIAQLRSVITVPESTCGKCETQTQQNIPKVRSGGTDLINLDPDNVLTEDDGHFSQLLMKHIKAFLIQIFKLIMINLVVYERPYVWDRQNQYQKKGKYRVIILRIPQFYRKNSTSL